MGAYVNYQGVVDLCRRPTTFSPTKQIRFSRLSGRMAAKICADSSCRIIQIDEYVPTQKLRYVDEIFQRRPDVAFRIYLFVEENMICDLGFLEKLPHVRRLMVDCLGGVENKEALFALPLESLYLELYDEKDFSFIRELQPTLKSFALGDTRASRKFDCRWLLKFEELEELSLRREKRNLECVSELPKLRKLSLRGVKPASWDFVNDSNISELSVNWCGTSDLSALAGNERLEKLSLWRLGKLQSLDFIPTLKNLRSLTLSALPKSLDLPDFGALENLEELYIDGRAVPCRR